MKYRKEHIDGATRFIDSNTHLSIKFVHGLIVFLLRIARFSSCKCIGHTTFLHTKTNKQSSQVSPKCHVECHNVNDFALQKATIKYDI